MRLTRIAALGFMALLATGAAQAAPAFQDCPFSGPMPDYAAGDKPDMKSFSSLDLRITQDGNDKDITVQGATCIQSYDEAQGKTDGSALEIMENYKESWAQQGADIVRDQPDYVVGHMTKDGREYWLNASASRDDGYTIRVVAVAPFQAALAAPGPQDCPFSGAMPGYLPNDKPAWKNWDAQSLRVTDGSDDKDIAPEGAICLQDYGEQQGKTDGTALAIMMNFKTSWQQQGATIMRDQPDYVVGHITKDGQEYWLNASTGRDDGYSVHVVEVQPFKRSLTAPGGNDYRLLGHMPGFTANPPDKKNYAEYSFPTDSDPVVVRGALFVVDYNPPTPAPAREITTREIIENYREALADLHAQILRDGDENISARIDDQGKSIYFFVGASQVVALEERPFKLTVQPPTADAMKDQLDKAGHIALYINFDFDKATLKPDAQPIIAQIVALLKRNPDLKVSIDGHTDSVGEHDYNVKLSQARAAAVVAAITSAGIDTARLTSAGYGPDKPIAPNDTVEGRAKNRRVELVKAS